MTKTGLANYMKFPAGSQVQGPGLHGLICIFHMIQWKTENKTQMGVNVIFFI